MGRLQTDPPVPPLLHHVVMVVPVYDVRRGEKLFLDWRGRWSGRLGFGFEEVRYIKGLKEKEREKKAHIRLFEN